MKIFFLSALSILLYSQVAFPQSLQLLPGSTFHDAVWDSEFGQLEDVSSPDLGGQLYLFLQNPSTQDVGIDSVHVQNFAGENQVFDGWYNWPENIAASNGNISSLLIKGINAPLSEGSDARVMVFTSDGNSSSFDFTDLATPSLRIANYVPSFDRNALWLYLRNDGATAVQLESVFFNEMEIPLLSTGQLATLYGSSTIAPNETRIINIQANLNLADLASYAIRIKYDTDQWVSGAVRIVAPYFPIGSWNSSGLNPENEFGRKRLRKVGVQTLHGPSNYPFIEDANSEYHIQVIREPSFGNPFNVTNAAPELVAQSLNLNVLAWTVDDEPDLNGKPIDEQLLKAKAYRDRDFDTPTHVNLAVQKKYQRYGWYTDIVSMDHYAAPSAPNVIPLTNIPIVGRMSEIEEAYAYSHQLKLNTEPRRMWSWVQFAASTWDVQPEPSAVNYQFWAHIAAGAKGMEYFVAQVQTMDDFPDLWAEGESLFKEFKQIRNACLYGEPSAISTSSNSDVLTYALVGPEAIVIIALNNSLSFGGNQLTGFTTNIDPQNYSVTVDVPSWLTGYGSYRVTPEGKSQDFSVSYNGNSVTLTPNGMLNDRMHVFVLHNPDNEAPKPLEGLNVADYVDSANYTLSWKEPFDNMGVEGYQIHYNGVLVGHVEAPIFEIIDQTINCSGYYSVTPYDNTGNLGQADSVAFVLSGLPLTITEQPTDTTVVEESTVILSIETSGLAGYQWQFQDEATGQWFNFNPYTFLGANSDQLTIPGDLVGVNGWTVRCIVYDPCGNEITSETVEVIVSVGIAEGRIQELAAFPNPTSGDMQILYPENNNGGTLRVFDKQGKLLVSRLVQKKEKSTRVDLANFENGIYLITFLNADGNLFTHRAILQR